MGGIEAEGWDDEDHELPKSKVGRVLLYVLWFVHTVSTLSFALFVIINHKG